MKANRREYLGILRNRMHNGLVKVINRVWKGAVVAAVLCAVPAYAEEIDFAKIPDVRIFKGDETIGYRDPAAWYEDGVFHLFVTVCDPSVPRMTIGHTTSRNLVDWSPVEYVLPMDKRFNWSSPGNIVKDGDERVLCFQKYPTPDATPTKVAFADDTARLYTIRTKDFKTWTKPELIMVKGPNVSEAEMGRMIDAYIAKGTDGLWWCFYKQQQDKSGKFSKKARMGVPFSVSPDLKTWTQKGFTDGGENVCVLPDGDSGGWLMLHAPGNGIGFKRSTDLVHWKDCGMTVLGQKNWRWAKGRITAATVIDCRAVKGVGKYVMFFHGSGPRKEIEGDCYKNCSIGIAWSDDLKEWTWPGNTGTMPPPAGQHCIYDAVPLNGAWEMSYCSNAWDSVACPKFKGVTVAKAVPGYWENMIPVLRAAGMKDAFRINPVYERQTIPMTQWAKCTTLPNIYGCFLYRRTFTLDAKSFRFGGRGAPALPAAYLAFDCVRNQVHAWVNGKFVAFRQGFSTPFELPIPNGVLREGENEIVLAVSNNPNRGYNGADVSGLTTRGLFEATGGIDGRLELRFARNGIRDVYVTTAKDLKTFTVHVGDDGRVEQVDVGKNNVHVEHVERVGMGENDSRVEHVERVDGRKILYEIKDAGGAVVAKGEAKGDFTLPTKGFTFWSPENPVRYTLTLTTPEGTCSQKFGIRRLVPDGERMRLNGELTYLRGVTEHCYFPETVQLPRDLAYYRMITAKRKELGFNFLRFHTFVPTDEYLEAMDELGIMVHIESPNFVTLDEYDAIVRFARRHPCVVAYCTGNETWIDGTAEKYLESVAKLVHAETDSLFTPMSAMRNVEYMVRRGKDTADKPFLHVPSRMARLAAYSDYFTSYQLGAVSYDSLNGASAARVDAWGDAYCGKPRTMHEICIDGSFCDITLEKDYPKDSPITKEGVFSEVRRHLAERGLLDRAPAYVRNSSEWMRRIRKFTFEKVRASRRIVGYDFLGDIDSRWHTFGYSDGMMDEFYRLKHGETVENVRRYNSAAVLLCSLGSDYNFRAGEKKRVAFTISNFAGDAKDAVVKVSLVKCEEGNDSHAEAQRGRERRECAGCVWSDERKVNDVRNGEVAAVGEFEVAIPAVEKPVKYLLRASFAGGAVKAENEWEVYAFPENSTRSICSTRPNSTLHNVRIVSNVSRDDLLAAMGRGERVLLLGKGPFKSLRTSFRIGLAGRTSGHYATIIKPDHPALEGMPHEGFCGWQFRRLMQNGAAVQLEAGVPFDPIIEVASSDKYLIRQAMLFEYKVGEGRLLVCSFAFGANDPAAAWLKARLEAYAASDAFNPKQSLTPDQLRAVIDAPLFSAEVNKNVALNPDDPASYVKSKKK